MKLLLLGCSGFIGKELVPKLIAGGHQLTIISRRRSTQLSKKFNNKNIEHIQLDASLSSSWENQGLLLSLKNAEGVINLAGEPIAEKRWSKAHCEKIKNSRINTTKCLVEALHKLERPTSVVISGSAIGFYGTSQESQFDENSTAGNDFLAMLCKEWENEAAKKPRATRLVILRIGIVLEKEGGALGKMLPIFRAGLGGPIGTGMQWMSWIHRKDICEIIEKALINKAWSGTFNAVAPEPVSMMEFSKTLGQVLNRPTVLKVPGSILKVLLGDGAKVVLEGQKVISKRLNRIGFKFHYPEISTALKSFSKRSS